MNKRTVAVGAFILAAGIIFFTQSAVWSEEKPAQSAADAEKEKAMKNPYPNDLGPEKIDVSKYTPEAQAGYKLLLDKCSRCHAPSRPLNSQFVDLKAPEIEALKKSNPEMLKDKTIWQIEDGIWQRYVKRMMAKPGCNISSEEGKKIWKFVVEDSKKRKTGAAAAKWSEHRKKLMADFKAKYPDRYKELFETK